MVWFNKNYKHHIFYLIRGELLEYNKNDILSIKVNITEPNYNKNEIHELFDYLANPDDNGNHLVKKNKKGIFAKN